MTIVPLSILIPTKNEKLNLRLCLEQLKGWADEIVVVDSQSNDGTIELAEFYGATVIQFRYEGGWPKKRQWALNTYPFRNEWILLLDADEILLQPIRDEISEAIKSTRYDGYWLRFPMHFLGRQLRYGDSELWKLFLFRKGKGRYEKRLEAQDSSMSDIEVHEHVIIDGNIGRLHNPVRHENINSLDRYIQKHNEYSNWEARVFSEGGEGKIKPALCGNQAQRRRWLKKSFMHVPASSLILFIYIYLLKFGFLDGIPGLIYCSFQAIQVFHVKSKIYEQRLSSDTSLEELRNK